MPCTDLSCPFRPTSCSPSFSGHGYPTQRATNTSCPRSDRLWLLELRVSRTFLDNLRLICSVHGYATQRAANTYCLARTVFGCLNSAFLDISQHFTGHLFSPWIPSSARRRRRTPMIHRGRARRTISAGSWFGQWFLSPPSSATAALPAPDRWRVTWRPSLSRMAGPGDPRRTTPRPSARHLETYGRPNGGVGRPLPEPPQ